MSIVLLHVALPFFLGLLAGQILSPRSPDGRLAHVLYGIGAVSAIWVFVPNPLELPGLVAIPGLILAGMLSGLFDGRRLIEGLTKRTSS